MLRLRLVISHRVITNRNYSIFSSFIFPSAVNICLQINVKISSEGLKVSVLEPEYSIVGPKAPVKATGPEVKIHNNRFSVLRRRVSMTTWSMQISLKWEGECCWNSAATDCNWVHTFKTTLPKSATLTKTDSALKVAQFSNTPLEL